MLSPLDWAVDVAVVVVGGGAVATTETRLESALCDAYSAVGRVTATEQLDARKPV